MMKLAFALAALVYLGYSVPVSPAWHDSNLNNQMIRTMEGLNKINVSFPSGFKLVYPQTNRLKNPHNCVIPFIKGLRKVLHKAIVPEDSKTDIERLMANLNQLESAQGNAPKTNATCKMVEKDNHSLPFSQYIEFVKKLNS